MAAVKTTMALLVIGMALVACSSEPAPTMQSKSPAPSATAPAKPPDESAALDAIRKTVEAQSTYFKLNRRYALTYDELTGARLLKSEPAAAETGYDFKLRPAADAQTYKLSVVPADAASTSARRFFADHTGVVHAETGKDASPESPEVK
jgi:hypothetical protein